MAEGSPTRDERPPLRYGRLAPWFHLLTHPKDYADEAAHARDTLRTAARRPVEEVLELGSGGGNNASHLKRWFRLTLVDLSDDMLETSRELNPECEHAVGDMRTVRLARDFDAVFVHDAICYLATEDDLRRAVETCFLHCRPGGAVLLCPDHVKETFEPETRHGGHDSPDGRGLRYVSWTWDPDPDDSSHAVAMAYLMRESDGSVASGHDVTAYGLFPRETWLGILRQAGFEARRLEDEWGRDVFVGLRPEAR